MMATGSYPCAATLCFLLKGALWHIVNTIPENLARRDCLGFHACNDTLQLHACARSMHRGPLHPPHECTPSVAVLNLHPPYVNHHVHPLHGPPLDWMLQRRRRAPTGGPTATLPLALRASSGQRPRP